MAVTIFVVRATITKDREAAFNKWYNEEHAPQVLQFNGAVSARRYKKILGEDKFQYMAVYEFASEAAFKRFQDGNGEVPGALRQAVERIVASARRAPRTTRGA